MTASVNRWQILVDHLKNFTLKRLSDTRWEAKISSVKAVRYQICDVCDALISLSEKEERHDPITFHEAFTLSNQLKDFGFIVSLVVWYDILFQINVISKFMQKSNFDVCNSVMLIEGCYNFLKDYKVTGLEKAISIASELASEHSSESEFKDSKRVRYKKKQFQYECKDEPITCAKKNFEVEFFNLLLDTAISSIEERFDMLSKHTDIWGFFYNFGKISSFKKDVLLKYCKDLQLALTVETDGDIEGVFLCDELISIQHFTKIYDCSTPLEVLNLI